MKNLSYVLLLAGSTFLYACGGETADTASTSDNDTTAASTTETDTDAGSEEENTMSVDHSAWDQALQTHVTDEGFVNYETFATDPALDTYLANLEANAPQEDWSREEAMAYWINAYNAYTVKLIVENYPLESITDIDGGQPWKREWINIGGKTLSLDAIENEILRPTYQDARVHFAINCASFSCPLLHNRAFTAENLEENLEALSVAFVNDTERNKVDMTPPQVSQIFSWFADDFQSAGGVIPFINKYAENPIAEDAELVYLEYDWSLNDVHSTEQ